ncbi:MAG: RNA polymerase sigma factor [Solirubrobacteraceae bacterium]|nr:RNA polymerase sigma factor [Solirubrobacteraceae bacterium]
MAQRQPSAGLRRLDPDDLGEHLDRLYRAAWAMCGSPHDAEDLVQETYAGVLSRPRWLRGEDDLGYLMRALRNTHANRVRTATRRVQTADLSDDTRPETSGRGNPEAALDLQELFAGIAALPERYRDALVAVDLLGLPYREAARNLRIREATLTSRLHRGRMQIAARLRADAGDEVTS